MVISADFTRLDADVSGYLNAGELASTNEAFSAWDTDGNEQVSRQEWETRLDERETVSEHQGQITSGKGGTNFASQTNFEAGDFAAIDEGGDGTITRDEWEKCGLDNKLFALIAGRSDSISQNDWNDYMETQNERQDQQSGAAGGGGKK